MKTLIATALIATAALTTASSAMTTPAEDSQIASFAPSVDTSDLTDAQVATILNVIHGGGSDSEKRGVIRSLVN